MDSCLNPTSTVVLLQLDDETLAVFDRIAKGSGQSEAQVASDFVAYCCRRLVCQEPAQGQTGAAMLADQDKTFAELLRRVMRVTSTAERVVESTQALIIAADARLVRK